MRYLAVGDIHGCHAALTTLAAFVPFTDDDVIITLGDYIDRGPNSLAVLDWLIDRARQCLLVPLRGNHELLMLRARNSEIGLSWWLRLGGDATLASYAPRGTTGGLENVPDEHWDFLENRTKPWFEIDTHFFVHANVDPTLPLAKQTEGMLYWESFFNTPAHESGKIMVCGHTPQKSGMPLNLGHAICIDTWVYGNGWLTCLDVATGLYWQANQRGETRVKSGFRRR